VDEDLWDFVDGLVGKGYEVISINSHSHIFVMLKINNILK
jgi:hypothetical protein